MGYVHHLRESKLKKSIWQRLMLHIYSLFERVLILCLQITGLTSYYPEILSEEEEEKLIAETVPLICNI